MEQNEMKVLEEVGKLTKWSLPTKFASNGYPKTDPLADAVKLYGRDGKDKAAVKEALSRLAAVGLVYFRADVGKVALTAAGLGMLKGKHADDAKAAAK
jgi:hypothetical protein